MGIYYLSRVDLSNKSILVLVEKGMKKLLILFAIFLLSSCRFIEKTGLLTFHSSYSKTISMKSPPPFADNAFSVLNDEVFISQCIKCHNPETALKRGRLDLTSKDNIILNFDEIIYRITDAFDEDNGPMPPRGNKATPETVARLKEWKEDAVYANLKTQLFDHSCVQCHNPARPNRLDLTSKESILNNGEEILYRLDKAFSESNRPMPPLNRGEKVEQNLIDLFTYWIQK